MLYRHIASLFCRWFGCRWAVLVTHSKWLPPGSGMWYKCTRCGSIQFD